MLIRDNKYKYENFSDNHPAKTCTPLYYLLYLMTTLIFTFILKITKYGTFILINIPSCNRANIMQK